MSCIVAFDLETVALPVNKKLQQGILDGKVRVDKVTKDPKKIYAKLKEKFWTQAEGAKIVAIGFAVLDMKERKVTELQGLQSDSTEELSEFVFDYLTDHPPAKLVGYNSEEFDFPKLERLVRLSPKYLPEGVSRWGHIDLIHKIPKFFSGHRPLKGSPISACDLYGIPYHDETSGADVAQMWETDKRNGTKEVLKYCLEDVKRTGQLFFQCSKLRSLL